jgi:cell division protein FtsL
MAGKRKVYREKVTRLSGRKSEEAFEGLDVVYISGSTVPRTHRSEETLHQVRTGTGRTEKVLQMNLAYVMFAVIAAVICIGICVNFLELQSTYTSVRRQRTRLETQLNQMRIENDTVYNGIISSVNLEHVKDVAMNELGMVYASRSQIYTYDGTENDYVKQYQDVP